MGSIASAFLTTATSKDWDGLGRGPTLRKIFAAYGVQDCWAVQRRFRQIDDGDGYVGYDELQQLVSAEEFNLLFLWDLFSQQNELMDITELLTVVCLFSSARLEEKGKFLLAVFDRSKLGVCTGAEISQLCFVMLGIFSKCIGMPAAKIKEIAAELKTDLPDLVPAYQEAMQLVGSEATFHKERVIHHSDLEQMLQPILSAYDRLPVARPPPDDCPPPPSLTWGVIAGPGGGQQATAARTAPPEVKSKSRELATASKSNEEPHLAWMSKMDAEPQVKLAESCPDDPPLRHWLLLHSADFATLAKDLPDFRRLFAKSVATAVGLPLTCIEVVAVSNAAGVGGSILVEFILHPPQVYGETRGTIAFLLVLESQLQSAHSALRKGPLGAYLPGAQLLANEPRRIATPPAGGWAATEAGICEQGVQTEPSELIAVPWPVKRPASTREGLEAELEAQVRAAVRALEAMRKRTLKAEAGYVTAQAELRRRQEALDELHLKEVLRQEEAARGVEN